MGTIVDTSKLIFQFTVVMSLLRSATRIPTLMRHCARIQQQQQSGYAAMAFTFASSAESFYDKASVKQVDLATFSGNIGILPDHVPLLAVLKPGVIEVIEENDQRKAYFASSGTVTINDDSSVQILCEEACPVENLDSGAAKVRPMLPWQLLVLTRREP